MGSGKEYYNQKITKAIPVKKFFSAQKGLLMYIAYLLGFVGFLPLDEHILCSPIMTPSFRRVKRAEMPSLKAFMQ